MNIEYGYIRLPLRFVNANLYYTRMAGLDVSAHMRCSFEPETYSQAASRSDGN